MNKGKSITLLSIFSVIMAILVVMTFARFPVGGTNNFNSFLGAIDLDYDVKGGYAYTYTLAKDNEEEVENIQDVLSTVKDRLDMLGYQTYSVKAIKSADVTDYDIRVELSAKINEYGVDDTTTLESNVENVFSYGELAFYGGTESNPDTKIFTEISNPIESVKYGGYSTDSGYYLVAITFSSEAFSELETAMGESSYYFKMTLGGESLAPFDGTSSITSTYFSGRTIVIQSATESAARQKVLQIGTGGLAYKYEKVEDNFGIKVSSPYGEKIGFKSVVSIGAIIILAIVAIAIKNKGFAFISFYSLVFFIVLEVAMLIAIPNITLGLSGILGILLATIMAIDGQVIVIKRISEEFANGKMVKPAVKSGIKRADVPVAVISIVAFIFAVALLGIVGGAVKSFAITLAIGAVLSCASTLLFTRLFANIFLSINGYKESFLNVKREK